MISEITAPLLDIHLQVTSLRKSFGSFTAVDDVSLRIVRGAITGLIGPNGAGKTTLFDMLAGDLQADSGTIEFEGQPVQGLPTNRRYTAGLARTFQIAQPFPDMTVLDNLMLAAPAQLGESILAPVFRARAIRQQEAEHLERAYDVLQFTTLDKVATIAASQLSGGQLKLLELARVLMGKPALILLDEPAAGVNPALANVLLDKIHALNDEGITFLIIEHNMELVMQHCQPIIAMANGKVIFEGTPTQAQQCEELLDSYLGGTGAAIV